jgi:CDP-diacylglycerol--glycerol-3-phosphate 3-phosphatidyltransferase
MNLPNSLTLLRITLIPIFVIFLTIRIPYGNYLAALVFIIAALTDSLDGYLARKWKQITKMGIILDPLADKLLITAALISLVELGQIAGWVAIVILGREFAVSGLRTLKAEEGIIIAASKLGKIKTISQIIAVILIILKNLYYSFLPLPIGVWAMYIAVVITIVSGIEYFRNFKISMEQ